MKTKIATLLLCVQLSVPVMAQLKSDQFFDYQDVRSESRIIRTPVGYETIDAMRFERMEIDPLPAPINNGVLLLIAFSSMYLILKSLKKRRA